jgi:oligoribonuclease NrnB/cAMP/cGMP phosphodiesterase (DHH superfamily)
MSSDHIKPLVISHAACFDGQASIWVAERQFGPDGATYVQLSHGQPFDPSIASSRDVYLIDFALPEAELRELARRSNTLTIIDHHKSAEPLYAALAREYSSAEDCANSRVTVVYDAERCGSMQAWNWFFPDEPPPQELVLINDYDLWRFKYADTKKFTAFLQTIPFDRDVWRATLDTGLLETFVVIGEAVYRYIELRATEIAANAAPIEFVGYTVPLISAPRALAGAAAAILAELGSVPFVMAVEVVPDGLSVSLRSAPPHGIDVSKIAADFGGGGHRHAAGYRLEMDFGSIQRVELQEGEELPHIDSKRPVKVVH